MSIEFPTAPWLTYFEIRKDGEDQLMFVGADKPVVVGGVEVECEAVVMRLSQPAK